MASDNDILDKLGNFLRANFPVEMNEIAFRLKSGDIVDIAMELMMNLDTEIAVAKAEVEKYESDFD